MCEKLIYLVSFVLALSLVGDVQADVVWTDAGPDHLWSTPTNWNTSVLPTSAERAVIDMLPGATVANEGAVAMALFVGSDYNKVGALTVDGGTLTIDLYVEIGRRPTGCEGTLNMNSGTITTGGVFTVGHNSPATLNMTGGAINIGETFRLAYYGGGIGHVNLDGGIITADDFLMRYSESAVGTMDVGGGTLIIDGNSVAQIQGYIDGNDPNDPNDDWITAYGGDGTLQLDYDVTNPGKTTLKAVHFLNPIPADGSTVPVTLNQLQWTLPETGPFGGVVSCSVFFGTNPSVWENPKLVSRQVVESVSVTLTADTMYYWAISLGDSESSTPDVPFAWTPAFTFYAVSNLPPIVNAGDDVETWLANGERVVQLDGSASDDGQIQALSYEWTVTAEPNELNPAAFDDATLPNATVTVRELGTYTLQLEAGDGEFTVADTMQIEVYADSCEHARNQEGFEWFAGDINHDCKVDFVDFANLAASWLQDNYSTE